MLCNKGKATCGKAHGNQGLCTPPKGEGGPGGLQVVARRAPYHGPRGVFARLLNSQLNSSCCCLVHAVASFAWGHGAHPWCGCLRSAAVPAAPRAIQSRKS